MGVSSDGLVFFGFPIPDSSETHERIEREKHAGPDGEPNPGTLGWLVWMGDKDGVVEIGTHCSGEYPMYFVAVKESVVRAWRGHPKDLTDHPIRTLDSARDQGTWRRSVADFCARWDVPFQEPRWYLASYWG